MGSGHQAGGGFASLPLTDPRDPAPAPGQARPPHLKALTTVRFFAALHVALYHLVRPFERWGPLSNVMGAGFTGVSFFFLLSGFILTYTHSGEGRPTSQSLRNFYFARFARIYPVYFLVTILSGVLMTGYFAKRIHILAFVADFLMVQTWSLRVVNFFNVPSWSVSMEAFFYLVFPFVVWRLRPRSFRGGVAQFLVFWALAMVAPAVASWRWPEPSLFAFWVVRFPPLGLLEFLAGVTLGWMLLGWRPAKRRASVYLLIGTAGLLLGLFGSGHLPRLMLHNGLLLPFFGLIVLGLSQDTAVSRLLSAPWLLLLGEASYSLYLTHFMLGDWLDSRFGWSQDFRSLPVKLAVSLGLSIGLFLCVERPSRRALLQWRNRRMQRVPAAV